MPLQACAVLAKAAAVLLRVQRAGPNIAQHWAGSVAAWFRVVCARLSIHGSTATAGKGRSGPNPGLKAMLEVSAGRMHPRYVG